MRHEEDQNEKKSDGQMLQVWQRPLLKRLASLDADYNESPGGDGTNNAS